MTTFWEESASGPPRRYYRLTDAGAAALAAFAGEWARFRDGVDALLTLEEGMTTMQRDPLVDDYLRRLEAAAADLPHERRGELLERDRGAHRGRTA